jgi:protein-S-isoprenylcysteine O-methyltransferase Ste14
MLPAILRWLTLAVFWGWFIFYWRGGADATRSLLASLREKNYPDAAAMSLIGILMLAVGLGGLALSLGWLPCSVSVLFPAFGLPLVLAGVTGMFYARHYLGHFWTAEATIAADHHIVDHGPYRVVRHPIYSFALIMYLGLALAFPNWWVFLPSLFAMVGYVVKAKLEDDYLAIQLTGYKEYQESVRQRLIPRVW